MRSSAGGARGIATIAALVLAGLAVAWVCVRATIDDLIAQAPFTTGRSIATTDPRDPDLVLSGATTALVRQFGHVDAATLAAVRRAAATAPLDARPYLILGHQQLLDREPARAERTFVAGQRLDPRNALIHVLLLDRYLRTARYADAAAQMSVLTRINGATATPIANAFAAMAIAPQTRDAVGRTLADNPPLEHAVLVALARADIPPATIFALASPAGRADAGSKDGWGNVLVDRLVERRRYAEARAVWTRIHGVPAAAAGAAIFNAAFRSTKATPPFDWTLTTTDVGAADLRNGALAVDYYGRDSGDLATQLLTIAPGRYRFSVVVDPGKTDSASKLSWTLACAGDARQIMALPVTAGPSPRRIAAAFAVPPGCAAQRLVLRGEAGDIPTPISLSFRSPTIVAEGAAS